jgi:hypothetical protein
MNLQENIHRIKSIMGIYEQQTTATTRCDQWKNGTFVNGDGITTPKITITKTPTLIEGLYEGPDSGGCIQRGSVNNDDTPHQLAGITVFYEAAPYLKELYKNGTYVKPDMPNIKMERTQNKKFKISIPLIPTTEDKAITNMNERGGMGNGSVGDQTEIEAIKNDPNYILKESVKKTEGDITEVFICFRNIIQFPIKTVTSKTTQQQQQPSQPNIQPQTKTTSQLNIPEPITGDMPEPITGDMLYPEGFRNNLRLETSGKSIDESSVVFTHTDNLFKVSYSTGDTKIAGMTLMFDNLSESKLNTRIENLKKEDLYPNLIRKADEWSGTTGNYYYEFLILKK